MRHVARRAPGARFIGGEEPSKAKRVDFDDRLLPELEGSNFPFERSLTNPQVVPDERNGIEILHDPFFNKGTAYSNRERDRLGLRGLVPPVQCSIEQQLERVLHSYHKSGEVLENGVASKTMRNTVSQHVYLSNLQDRNETLFYRLVCDNIEEMAPIIYTPTVGYACQHASQLFRRGRGLYLSAFTDRGDMHSIVGNWPARDVDVIVMTDGSRILGLGDLGVHGMPIPVGKLALYTSAGGIDPTRCLPIMIDMGTNNPELLEAPMYLGTKKPRITGQAYFDVMDEVMDAVLCRYPNAVIQHEDFKTPFAEAMLERYRDKCCFFNDDIQGTGTMCLSGILSALRVQGKTPDAIKDQRIVCLGAGSAGLGVCGSLVQGMKYEGLNDTDAARNFWLVDKNGLLTSDREVLAPGQAAFARNSSMDSGLDLHEGASLLEVVRKVKPTVLLGLSGVGGTFTKEVIEEMSKYCDMPIIFAMSNPTDRTECSSSEAYEWSKGKCIYASGSPQPEVVSADGRTLMVPSQANNMFIYPGVGLGAVASRSRLITNRMMYAAAKQLTATLTSGDIQQRKVFPRIRDIRDVSLKIACAVVAVAQQQKLVTRTPREGQTWEEFIRHFMWSPTYRPLIRRNDTYDSTSSSTILQ